MEYNNHYVDENPQDRVAAPEPKKRGSWWGSFFKILFGFVLGVAITETVFICKLNNMEPKVTIVEKDVTPKSEVAPDQSSAEKEEGTVLSDIKERVIKEIVKQIEKNVKGEE